MVEVLTKEDEVRERGTNGTKIIMEMNGAKIVDDLSQL